MSKGEHRRFTAEQKLEILRQAEQPGVTVSEVRRRNALAPSVFYRWRAVAQNGSAVALKQDAKRTSRKDERQARQEAEMAGRWPGGDHGGEPDGYITKAFCPS